MMGTMVLAWLLSTTTTITLPSPRCTVPVLLAALEEADREFVNDLNERPYGELVFGGVSFEQPMAKSNVYVPAIIDNRRPSDKLRDDAAELERKSAAAKRIREVITTCNKHKP